MAIPESKICTKCGFEKSLDEFAPEPRRAMGRSAWCKTCVHDYNVARTLLVKETPPAKTCSKCQFTKPIEAFGDDKYTKDGKATRCVECKREESAAYRSENPEKVRAATAAWKRDHPEDFHATIEKGRAKKNKRRRERYLENKAKENAQAAAWHAAHPGYAGIKDQRRRTRLRNLPYTWTSKEREFMYQYWKHSCAVCGNEEGLWWCLAEDHWIPVTSPDCPGTVATNMIPLCHGNGGCNNSKHKAEPHEWLLRRFGPRKTAKIEKAIAAYFAIVRTTFNSSAAD